MKTTPLRYSLIGLITLTVLYSCTKETALKPPGERILGKWHIVREAENAYDYNTGRLEDASDQAFVYNEFTIEFRSDGMMYSTVNRGNYIERDTFYYELQGESLLLIDNQEYFIKSFTNTSLVTTDYYDDGFNDVEHILELRK